PAGPGPHGPAGPRGAGAAALRAAEQRRDGPRAGRERGGCQPPLRSSPVAAQGHPDEPPGRVGEDATVSNQPSGRDPIDRLAEDFVARYRRGERPSPREYAERHPELAGQLEEVLQALALLEDLRPGQAPDPAPRAAPTEVPSRLGEFRILREIGRGGMGV